MTPEQIAQQAASLGDNDAFNAALDHLRDDALASLATISRNNIDAFYRAQAAVKVVDDIRADLERFLRAGQPKKPPGIA